MLNYIRKIETFWNSLFDDKYIWYRCIQDVQIKFAGAIKIDTFDNSIANLNTRYFFDHEHFRIFLSIASRVPWFIISTPYNCLGFLIHPSKMFMSKIMWILPCFHIHVCLKINTSHSVIWNRWIIGAVVKASKKSVPLCKLSAFYLFQSKQHMKKLFLWELNSNKI